MDFTKYLRNSKTFFIAEIGQNHQGCLETAKKLIKTAKDCGADCAKFQKTALKEKFNRGALRRPYSSPHSFGTTYGEHKEFLEFSEEQFKELQAFAKSIDILLSASAMDMKSLEFLISSEVPFIKIGSGDANNFILIERAAQSGLFLIISTGMQSFETVKTIYNIVSKYHKNFALLHCVSSYPTPVAEINLSVIDLYKEHFPDVFIGYSGHELGTHITAAAVALGAKIIERHITLDKTQKGSDHSCSLNPTELQTIIHNIRAIELAMGVPIKRLQESEKSCYEKLGKSLVFTKNLQKGHKLTLEDLNVKVAEPKGLDGCLLHDVVGKILVVDGHEDEPVLLNDFEKMPIK
ncbi:sialic acid synthase [Diabrotica virgifera virgifera]|uniref:Sialic acid synthase n=1 Tax=Diabrotica virgifera virgifera TaxID=50390 RepID=A0A6P7EZW5_DIAVI|nr:sialic acid synthase [Diabrotica virgifera virgifera]